MDVATTMATTLLGFLLIWMVIFAVLALRPAAEIHSDELVTQSVPSKQQTVPAAPVVLHKIVPQPLQSHMGSFNQDTSNDIGTASVM